MQRACPLTRKSQPTDINWLFFSVRTNCRNRDRPRRGRCMTRHRLPTCRDAASPGRKTSRQPSCAPRLRQCAPAQPRRLRPSGPAPPSRWTNQRTAKNTARHTTPAVLQMITSKGHRLWPVGVIWKLMSNAPIPNAKPAAGRQPINFQTRLASIRHKRAVPSTTTSNSAPMRKNITMPDTPEIVPTRRTKERDT